MRTIVIDDLSVCHAASLCKNNCTDRSTFGMEALGQLPPTKHCIRWEGGPDPIRRRGKGSQCSCHQITSAAFVLSVSFSFHLIYHAVSTCRLLGRIASMHEIAECNDKCSRSVGVCGSICRAASLCKNGGEGRSFASGGDCWGP